MNIQRSFFAFIIYLFFVPFAQGQIDIDKLKHASEDHAHQDSSYHCGMCNANLFGSHEATIIDNNQLHIHGIGTDENRSPFHCSGCSSHLGYYNHEHDHYEVDLKSLDQKSTGKFHCAACQLPIFDEQELTSSDEFSSHFKQPIDQDRIVVKGIEKFYKVAGSHISCKACNGRLGEVSLNDSRGFGLRINLGAVKKKKGRRR